MSCAGGSVVVPPEEPQRDRAVPLGLPDGAGETSGDALEDGGSGDSSASEGRRCGSESGCSKVGAAAGEKSDTRSVCSSGSGSGSHLGGAGPICKICFQGAEQGELLNPCRCDGSVRYTHQLCLLKWISERGSWTCELCCYRYHIIAIKMKKPCQGS